MIEGVSISAGLADSLAAVYEPLGRGDLHQLRAGGGLAVSINRPAAGSPATLNEHRGV